jgi:hypothetical protein
MRLTGQRLALRVGRVQQNEVAAIGEQRRVEYSDLPRAGGVRSDGDDHALIRSRKVGQGPARQRDAGDQRHRYLVAEAVPDGKALSRGKELARLYLKAPEVTRRDRRIHFIQPLKDRIVRGIGYGLSVEGPSAADLAKSMQAQSESVTQKGKSAKIALRTRCR